MQRMRVDTTLSTYVAAGEPEPATDYDTKAPKLSGDGRPLYQLSVAELGPEGAQVLIIKVPGEPKGIAQGTAVRISGLVATYYELPDRSGISFRAERIEPISPATSKAA